jgi:sodium pump decarboxylase gamma subunit
MMTQGLVLMLVGMVTVYVFLYLLVALMRLIALVVPRFDHLMPGTPAPVPKTSPSGRDVENAGDEESILAIAVAMAAARGRRLS